MTTAADMRLLALLVHQGLVPESDARKAASSGDPKSHLIQTGVVTAQQWLQWQQTSGGTRPVLSRYELQELLGEGGVARVFAAIDRTDNRRVALKVMRPELSKDSTQVERFVKEARLLMTLEHPHVVRGFRVAKEGEVFFFAMELLPGRCLQDVLAESGRLDEETALEIVAEVADALSCLHQRGLVHRDVKPGNILWSEERGAVLIDLGFAVAGGSAAAEGETTAGTVHYIAPEQAKGQGGIDARADIYALGATLYHLVTGSLPFAGQSSEEVLAKQVLESLSGERIRDLQLSPQLHYFIEKMMAKEREIRFQDPQQLRSAVEGYLQQLRDQRELEERSERPKLGGRRPPQSGRHRRRRR
jgi:serine/threonine-protein kinase